MVPAETLHEVTPVASRQTLSACILALAALGLAVGCGKPSAPPEQFVGTWIAAPPGAKELKPGASPTLTLLSDGTGFYIEYPDPHARNVSWVPRADKLILADRDGTGSTTFSYRFNGRDELVMVMNQREATFRRYIGPKPQPPRAAGKPPTTR
jgi:hypothetical protein